MGLKNKEKDSAETIIKLKGGKLFSKAFHICSINGDDDLVNSTISARTISNPKWYDEQGYILEEYKPSRKTILKKTSKLMDLYERVYLERLYFIYKESIVTKFLEPSYEKKCMTFYELNRGIDEFLRKLPYNRDKHLEKYLKGYSATYGRANLPYPKRTELKKKALNILIKKGYVSKRIIQSSVSLDKEFCFFITDDGLDALNRDKKKEEELEYDMEFGEIAKQIQKEREWEEFYQYKYLNNHI